MYEMNEKVENFVEQNEGKKYNKKKNHNRNFMEEVKEEAIVADELNVQKEEMTESAPIETTEVVEDKAPVEAKPLTKGVVVHIGKYAAMVKTGKEEFVMKPEFVNCKVGDIVEF